MRPLHCLGLLVLPGLSGCATPLAHYRSPAPEADCLERADAQECGRRSFYHLAPERTATDDKSLEPVIAYLELDDQGALMERQDAMHIFREIRTLANGTVAMVAYAHGWHHNADPMDENVRQFKKMLVHLDAGINVPTVHRRVIGIYIGWRGKASSWEPTRTLSFWSRKNASLRIGNEGVVEIVSELSSIRNDSNLEKREACKCTGPENSLVIAGHSFGAQMILTGTKHLLMQELVTNQAPAQSKFDAQAERDAVRVSVNAPETPAIADLLVLVNPAVETTRIQPLLDRSRQFFFRDGQLPELAVFLSQNDRATGWAFPAGRFFSTAFKRYRTVNVPDYSTSGPHPDQQEIGQKALDMTGIGHLRLSQTHALGLSDNLDAVQHGGSWADYICNKRDDYSVGLASGHSITLTRFDKDGSSDTNFYDEFNPYMIVTVSPRIIDGHSKVWEQTSPSSSRSSSSRAFGTRMSPPTDAKSSRR